MNWKICHDNKFEYKTFELLILGLIESLFENINKMFYIWFIIFKLNNI